MKKKLVPPSIVKALKDSEAIEGIPFEFTCEASGVPKPEITWFFEETQLKEDDNFEISTNNNTYTLKIKNPNDSSNGLYKAIFKNDLGTVETKGNLTVLSKIIR
jgi:hypothetical protein